MLTGRRLRPAPFPEPQNLPMSAPHKIVRHPRDSFDSSNEFVFMKRLRFNLPDYEFCQPGDPVTPKLRHLITEPKLKVWFQGGFIATREYAIAVGIPLKMTGAELKAGKRVKREEAPAVVKTGETSMSHLGGGWYEVTHADGSTTKVKGKAKAESML